MAPALSISDEYRVSEWADRATTFGPAPPARIAGRLDAIQVRLGDSITTTPGDSSTAKLTAVRPSAASATPCAPGSRLGNARTASPTTG